MHAPRAGHPSVHRHEDVYVGKPRRLQRIFREDSSTPLLEHTLLRGVSPCAPSRRELSAAEVARSFAILKLGNVKTGPDAEGYCLPRDAQRTGSRLREKRYWVGSVSSIFVRQSCLTKCQHVHVDGFYVTRGFRRARRIEND